MELLTYVWQKIDEHISRAMANRGLRTKHYRALFFVAIYPGISAYALGDKLGITKQSLSPILSDLSKAAPPSELDGEFGGGRTVPSQ
ncbi:MAG: helix-turn-helix domain-containing protein [Sphingomonas sp.]